MRWPEYQVIGAIATIVFKDNSQSTQTVVSVITVRNALWFQVYHLLFNLELVLVSGITEIEFDLANFVLPDDVACVVDVCEFHIHGVISVGLVGQILCRLFIELMVFFDGSLQSLLSIL
jgi:hypothetical protein